jgi:SagB-type dehydrogenase family enzyme
VPFDQLFELPRNPSEIDERSVGSFLRHSMGLSAWKAFRESRWALRVNPSSGNLHPTEAYVVLGGRVCHYAAREHALEERTVLATEAWTAFLNGREAFLVALTSIHWREAWKYGERAFRYCQHDTGHAIGALRHAAALFGWTMRLLPEWSDARVAALLGVDRDGDRAGDAEREEPECLMLVAPDSGSAGDPSVLVDAARRAAWHGQANRLSAAHVEWPIIDRVAEATRYPGYSTPNLQPPTPNLQLPTPNFRLPTPNFQRPTVSATEVILQRRSAIAFDGRSALSKERFLAMLSRLCGTGPPWDAIDWPPHVHLAVFVHRVDGLAPGVYAYLRDDSVLDKWRSAMRPEFLWEHMSDDRLFLLLPHDVTWAAARVSCDQDIAGAGFFSLGMIARLSSSLHERGEWFYRRLFWECGMIGQVLYLEAEAAGARATGIGCFYDDPVHELLGLSGTEWQSLYHFSMGMPVEDTRLTTEPGYGWMVDGG